MDSGTNFGPMMHQKTSDLDLAAAPLDGEAGTLQKHLGFFFQNVWRSFQENLLKNPCDIEGAKEPGMMYIYIHICSY